MELVHGNIWSRNWSGLEEKYNEIMLAWAKILGDCSIGAIMYALDCAERAEKPPLNAGGWLALCMDYKPPEVLKLDLKISEEKRQENLKRLEGLRGFLTKGFSADSDFPEIK